MIYMHVGLLVFSGRVK